MGKTSIADKLVWLEFRDSYIAKQPQLICHYCQKQLVSDVPTSEIKKPKERIFERIKGLNKDLIATVDHVIPTSKGGPKFDETNFVVACPSCNTRKAAMSLEEWMVVKDKPVEPKVVKAKAPTPAKPKKKKRERPSLDQIPIGELSTRVFIKETPKGKTVMIWAVDKDGNQVGDQPMIGFRKQKAQILFRHIEEMMEVFKEDCNADVPTSSEVSRTDETSLPEQG